MSAVRFYEGEYYLFSNFSAHRVFFEDVEYMTAEHAYQVAKFIDPIMREKIRLAPSAYLAREWAQTKDGQVANWNSMKVEVMKKIMHAKAEQHSDVREKLFSTENAVIEKNHPLDDYWGTGKDGNGQNIMGKIWMEIRDELRRT